MLHLYANGNHMMPEAGCPGIAIVAGGEEEFLVHAANCAFWNTPAAMMRKLLEEKLCLTPSTDMTDVDLLMEGFKKVKDCEGAEAALVLEAKLAADGDGECQADLEMLQSEGAKPMGQSEACKDYDHYVAELKVKESTTKQVIQKIRAVRLVTAKAASGPSSPRAKDPGVAKIQLAPFYESL